MLDKFDTLLHSREPQLEVLDDCSLMKRVQAGDEQALASLYDRYSNLVYSVALRVLRNTASAEDVLQEIFMQIWFSLDRLEVVEATFSRWLSVVARNRSIDLLRRGRPVDTLEGVIVASSYNLASHAEQNLMCEKAKMMIAKLPSEQRRLLEMAFFEGMSHSEISVMTGRPLGTIKSSIRMGLLTLRKSLPPDDAGQGGERVTTIDKTEQFGHAELAPIRRPRAPAKSSVPRSFEFANNMPPAKKRQISAEGKARIAEAQRLRWAKARKGRNCSRCSR